MKDKINAYLAMLIVTVMGSGAAMIIVHVATTTSDEITASLGGAKLDDLDIGALHRTRSAR